MARIAIVYALVLFGFILAVDLGYLRQAGNYVNDHPPLDKILHFAMYGVLALLINTTLTLRGLSHLRAFSVGTIVVIVVSSIEEYSNLWVVSRNWSLGDLAANYLGVVWLGSLPAWVLQRVTADSREVTGASAQVSPSRQL